MCGCGICRIRLFLFSDRRVVHKMTIQCSILGCCQRKKIMWKMIGIRSAMRWPVQIRQTRVTSTVITMIHNTSTNRIRFNNRKY